jgi:hypothetical protein
VGISQGHETIGNGTDGRGEAWRVRVLVLKDLVEHRGYEVPSDQIASGMIRSVLTAPRPLDKRR